MRASPPRTVAPLVSRLVPDEVLLAAYHERGDRAARERLIERHLPLVRRLAWRYRSSGEPLDDLVQCGCVGLVKAVDKFDPQRGDSLRAYAIPTIVGEIRRYLRDRGGSVHAPRQLKELALALHRVLDDLTASLLRSPTIAELAQALDVDAEQVVEAMGLLDARHTLSLGQHDPSSNGVDLLGAPDRSFNLVHDRAAAAEGLRALDSRERAIVVLSFFGGLTQSQIGARLGISQMHVSRLLRGALEKASAAAERRAVAA